MRSIGTERRRWTGAKLAGVLIASVIGGAGLPAMAGEIIIHIDRVRALDRIDPTTSPDFFAQLTVGGQVFKTQRIKNAVEIRPSWVITATVPRGVTPVNFAILDNNVLKKDELIDVNRLDNKRDLDFRVDTRSCQILDFSQSYRCRDRITRGGAEKKAAEVTFRVEVRRRR